MSYEEISAIMDINMNSTYRLLYKVLDNLQKASNKQTWLLICCILCLLGNLLASWWHRHPPEE